MWPWYGFPTCALGRAWGTGDLGVVDVLGTGVVPASGAGNPPRGLFYRPFNPFLVIFVGAVHTSRMWPLHGFRKCALGRAWGSWDLGFFVVLGTGVVPASGVLAIHPGGSSTGHFDTFA